jgi:hypothetical protein
VDPGHRHFGYLRDVGLTFVGSRFCFKPIINLADHAMFTKDDFHGYSI